MQFREFFRNRWGFVISAVFFVFGLPGHKSDAETWIQWAGKVSYPFPEQVSWFLMGAGGFYFLVWAFCHVTEWLPKLWRNRKVRHHQVAANSVNHSWHIPEPKVTVIRAAVHKRVLRSVRKFLKEIFALLVLAVALVLLAWAVTSYKSPPPWTHPTLSGSEQEQTIAECEMDALRHGYAKHQIGSAHYDYVNACLTSLGFVRE